MTPKHKRELFKEMEGMTRREERNGGIAGKRRNKNKITWHGT